MPVFVDQLGREVEIPDKPSRIVSLVPSQTELLFDLGLTDEVVGITKFCVHPVEWFRTKTRVGGTKNVNSKKIQSLRPDFIIANKEENVREQIEELAKDFPVWVSDVNNLEDALSMIENVGAITGKAEQAQTLSTKIKNNFADQKHQTLNTKLQTAYLIWKDPYMTAGGDTFISNMLIQAGFQNVFANKSRYPIVTIDDLLIANCQLLLLSSEPYPFKQKHIDELQIHLPDTKIVLVDGEMFSWYGSRLLQAPSYFAVLHRQIEAML